MAFFGLSVYVSKVCVFTLAKEKGNNANCKVMNE